MGPTPAGRGGAGWSLGLGAPGGSRGQAQLQGPLVLQPLLGRVGLELVLGEGRGQGLCGEVAQHPPVGAGDCPLRPRVRPSNTPSSPPHRDRQSCAPSPTVMGSLSGAALCAGGSVRDLGV